MSHIRLLLIQDFQIQFLAIRGSHFPKRISIIFSHKQPEVYITVEDVIVKRRLALSKYKQCCRKQKTSNGGHKDILSLG